MIRFSCICGEKFEVPTDCAGDEMQCPACRRLVDVPRLGDLDAFAADGTVRLAEAAPPESTLDEQLRAFGYQQDMRRNVDEFLLVGEDDSSDPAPKRAAPRYDPETGELVTEIPVKEDVKRDRPQDIPMATPTLNYSSGPDVRAGKGDVRWYELPWRLLTGHSLIAISFVFAAHALIHFVSLIPVLNLLFVPITLLIFLTIVAHYCNVVEDFGPHQIDHVPVMLRNVSFSEDLVHPLYNVGFGILFAYGPAIALTLFGLGARSDTPWIFWAMMAYGTIVFLAGVFTGICSGALQNMLPQHALSIIFVAPLRYFLALLMFLVAMAAYAVAFGGLAFTNVSVLTSANGPPLTKLAISAGITYAFCALAVYCMHLSAAWLGMIYRTHYPRLNWVLQSFSKADRTDTNARLAEMRKRGDPRVRGNRKPNGPQDVGLHQPTGAPAGRPPLAKAVPARGVTPVSDLR